MKRKSAAPAERVIRRYGNRKLYDPQARRYVTLDDLGRMVARGGEVRVMDQSTGEDLTTVVLAQVVLEGIKQRTALIPRQVLARLIRLGAEPGRAGAEWPGPQEAAARAREEAGKIVESLLARGRLTLDETLALRQDVSETVQRLVTEAQHGLEARLRGLLESAEREAVTPALQTLKERLMTLEGFLGRAGKAPPREKAKRKRKKE